MSTLALVTLKLQSFKPAMVNGVMLTCVTKLCISVVEISNVAVTFFCVVSVVSGRRQLLVKINWPDREMDLNPLQSQVTKFLALAVSFKLTVLFIFMR